MDEGDDDGERLLVQALDVGDYDAESLELDIPPVSGIDYLRRVQYESRRCPRVVTAVFNTEVFRSKQTVTVSNDRACLPAPPGVAPTLDLQRQYIADFTDVRQKVARYKAQVKSTSQSAGQRRKAASRFCVPAEDSRDAWYRFCFGPQAVSSSRETTRAADSVSAAVSDGEATSYVAAAESPAVLRRASPVADATGGDCGAAGQSPLICIVASLDQSMLLKVLEYHVSFLEESASTFTQAQGRWLYALLACLEKPLIPEACSLIRTLARACAALRTRVHETGPSEAEAWSRDLRALSLLICLVARYFDQKDMADEAT